MIALALLLAAQAAPTSPREAASIEQLAAPRSAERPAEAPPQPLGEPSSRAAPSTRITQLPPGLAPRTDDEDKLAGIGPERAQANIAAVEVARALGVIRARGQQPTPELIAREVGPEVLEDYLSRGAPAAVPIAPAADPALDAGKDLKDFPAGVTIIPPGGGQ